MAYQNVTSPRFYIDRIESLSSLNFDFEKAYNNAYSQTMYRGYVGKQNQFYNKI